MERSRTFHWEDPTTVAAQARGQSGIEFLRSILGKPREAAPVAECLGFRLIEAEPGRVAFELTPGEHQYNPIGSVHGGVLATLCDSAAGAAVHSTLKAGEGYTTLEIKVSFLRAVTADTGPLRCEGTVVSRGSRVAVSESKLTDGKGKLYAIASSTCLVLSG